MPFTVPSLLLVIDRRLYRVQEQGEPALSLVEQAIEGGITMVQLRLSDPSDASAANGSELAANAVAQRLREMTAGHIPFLVTSDLELADRSRADGVVLVGDKTYRPDDARDYLHSRAVIGCVADSIRSAAIAEHGGADFVLYGPVFNSGGADALGMIRKLKDALNIPLVACGGVDTPELARAVSQAGADGIAVSAAILDAPDPKYAAQALKAALSP